jgi:hypothetical protein
MRKPSAKVGDDGMRAEYDFSNAVRGKYYERYRASTNVVVLDPDVAKAFPNAEAVNKALRVLVSVARAGYTRLSAAQVRSGGRTSGCS